MRRAAAWVRWGLVGTVFALAVLAPTTYVAVEKSSEPQFCNSCHIMEPFYASWERSAHSAIKCVECHFEPGTMGTAQGKFQAISQLAKYVTRTQGTRPWADVSDASCVRSGCHSLSSLEGPIEFGRVSFDHRPHLLEARGKRLRCVTCHSQVLVDQHFAVEESVCFACHFTPGPDGRIPARTGDCLVCHAPPQGVLEVAGRPFEHAEYLGRGVDCRDCHASITEGAGTVHPQRCRSCHGEPELLARLEDPVLLHRAHVTERKVECFECHLEIHHGSEPPPRSHPSSDEGCAACHAGSHDAARLVLAGAGAIGVERRPSRMLETHVACQACHTGRAGHGAAGASERIASAGEVDCLHCHGIRFAGMLAGWQGTIGSGLARLRSNADALEGCLAQASDPRAGELREEALRDLELLERDGSRGAHNAPFALAVLRAATERIDQAWGMVDPEQAVHAAELLPVEPDAACGACHLDIASQDPLEVHSRPFHHQDHLRAAGLSCSSCHLDVPYGSEPHGAPAFPREECASCHHAESERLDPGECSRCHAPQVAFFTGRLEGVENAPVAMPEKDCTSCHGEPPDIVIPPATMCGLCHEEGYGEKLAQWRATTDDLRTRLEAALAAAGGSADPQAVEAARAALELVAADGSRGVHNFSLAERLLADGLARLGAR